MLTDKKVLITGATGFIGGRLVEKLILYHGADVRALVRNFAHAARIARFRLEMVGGDIADADAVDRAVAGCDAVFHCAHDLQNAQRNLDGVRVLAEACLRHGVRRFVHVSTISVYEPLPDGDLDESSPVELCGWEYADNKLAVERELLRYADEHSLPVVVIQPTIVYGPFSKPWTIGPVGQLRTGRVVLPDDGGGLCNAVYVDDVVDALILAAQKDEAMGERFLISGAAPVTWREFYAAYERVLGVQSVIMMPAEEIERIAYRNGTPSNLRLLWRNPRRLLNWAPVRSLYAFARPRIGEHFWKKAEQALPAPVYIPDEQTLSLYRARAGVKIDKAQRLLEYEPAFSFDRGMSLTAQFIVWANL